MLIEKLSINVGETTMYVEMHSEDTPLTDLQYGDCKWDSDKRMLIWYGLPEEDSPMTGWVNSPWGASNTTGAILHLAANSKNNPLDVIWRIKNNDITFDASTYSTDVDNVIEPNKQSIEYKRDNNG